MDPIKIEISLSDVLDRIAAERQQHENLLPLLENFITVAVPNLTKDQACYLLNASPGHVDNLVSAGFLQERQTGSVAKYESRQVLKCFFENRTGRKDNVSLLKFFRYD